MIRRGTSWWGWWQKQYIPPPETGTASLVGGFQTEISATGHDSVSEANLTGFDTVVTAYGGGSASLGGFATAITATGTLDGYGTANLDGFTSSIAATGLNGSVGTANLKNGFTTSINASSGDKATLTRFTTTISATGINGAVGSVSLGSFTTTLTASATAIDFGVATIRAPIISLLWGEANLGGFSTRITSNNNTVNSNAIAYAINTKTAETTQYTNYDFDYIVKLAGNYYGVKSDGYYLIGGADDNGAVITAKFKTANMDFDTALYKRVPYMYLDSDNASSIALYVDDTLKGSYSSGFNGRRTKLARGPKGRYFAFEVSNVSGGPFEINSLEAFAQVTSRKV